MSLLLHCFYDPFPLQVCGCDSRQHHPHPVEDDLAKAKDGEASAQAKGAADANGQKNELKMDVRFNDFMQVFKQLGFPTN